MPVYELQGAYEAYRDGCRFGPWQAGDRVELAVDDAEWIGRDCPGVLADATGRASADAPTPAAGSRPRVGGDPDRADAAAEAKARVDADSDFRQSATGEGDLPGDDEYEPVDAQRAQKPTPNRAARRARNRSV